MNIKQRVLNLIDRFRDRLPSDHLFECRSLAKHNEWGIALENLCTQLYEFDQLPSFQELKEIRQLANEMHMKSDVWNFLRPQPTQNNTINENSE
jgi:hypothetical protein